MGAVGTYWGSRSQHRLRLRELDLEIARQDREEARRAKREESEDCEHRRSLYLQYLGALDSVVHATSVEALNRDGLGKRWAEFIAADDEVELGGTDAVKEASYPVHRSVRKIVDAYATVIDDPAKKWPQDALLSMDEFRSDYGDARSDIVGAMREDLLDPDSKRKIDGDGPDAKALAPSQ